MTSASAPIIGILADVRMAQQVLYLKQPYVRAILETGGVPIVLPAIPDEERRTMLADRIDGLVVTGSFSDVDPANFGEAPRPGLGPLSPEREEQDRQWITTALASRIPILAICYGCQILNVVMGGTLYQDLLTDYPHALQHQQTAPPEYPCHDVILDRRSVLYRWTKQQRFRVNSLHHQGIRTLGPGLRPVAWAPDGLIEAFESESMDTHWILGVQWHPERLYVHDPAALAIFQGFVHYCRQRTRTPTLREER